MEMSYKNEDDLVDYEKAFFYFNKAYQRKEKESLYYLGDLFHYGRGVEQDSEKAIFYFEEYFNEGNYFVLQYIVKLIFYDLVDNCVFLERDSITVRIKDKKDLENAKKCKDYLVKSIEYLEEIIDQLYSKSEFNYYLALMYAIGSHFLPNGHTKNSQIAKEYFSKACKEEEEYEGCKRVFRFIKH